MKEGQTILNPIIRKCCCRLSVISQDINIEENRTPIVIENNEDVELGFLFAIEVKTTGGSYLSIKRKQMRKRSFEMLKFKYRKS